MCILQYDQCPFIISKKRARLKERQNASNKIVVSFGIAFGPGCTSTVFHPSLPENSALNATLIGNSITCQPGQVDDTFTSILKTQTATAYLKENDISLSQDYTDYLDRNHVMANLLVRLKITGESIFSCAQRLDTFYSDAEARVYDTSEGSFKILAVFLFIYILEGITQYLICSVRGCRPVARDVAVCIVFFIICGAVALTTLYLVCHSGKLEIRTSWEKARKCRPDPPYNNLMEVIDGRIENVLRIFSEAEWVGLLGASASVMFAIGFLYYLFAPGVSRQIEREWREIEREIPDT
jgi:hypothetical protein